MHPMTEQWKTIPEFPMYSVSNLGRIKTHHTRKGIGEFRKLTTTKQGYLRVGFYSGGKLHNRYVHCLVAQAFLEPDPQRPQVNHKKGVAFGHGVDNLEWMTRKENVQHGYDVLGRQPMFGERNGRTVLTTDQVLEIKALIAAGKPNRFIAPLFSVKRHVIKEIRSGKNWSHVKL